MKRIIWIILTTFVVLFLSLGGCGLIESRISRITIDFKVWPSDDRVLYETGAEALAEKATAHLPRALEAVENKQYGKFKEPVTIYVFASTKSFSKFSNISEKARGASLGNEVYLSGMLLELPDEVYGMIGHELSHVQLSQTLGVIAFNRTIPRWFREGLAIYVSDGGGAPRNYEKETIDAFIQGKHFLPVSKGALLNRSLKATDSIGPKMFYSQSGMFVHYLANDHPMLFEKLLISLQAGNDFSDAFIKTFNSDAGQILANYIDNFKKTDTMASVQP